MTTKERRIKYEKKRENSLYFKCDWINCEKVAEYFGFPIENENTIKLCEKHVKKAVEVQGGLGSERDRKDFRRVLRKYKDK